MSRPHEFGLVYFVADGLTLLTEASVYFISRLPTLALVMGALALGTGWMPLALIVAWCPSALLFVTVIVGMLVGEILARRYPLTSKCALRWVGVAVIPAGETWAGNPAARLDLFGRRLTEHAGGKAQP